jgi:hypothetical protein
MTRAIATAAAALAIALVAADAAQACSCAPIDAHAALENSDGAFVGRLLAVRVVDPPVPGEPTSSADPTDYIYRVGRVYNGGPGLRRGRRVKVRSARDSATCGLPDARGRLYGLFLTRRNGRWTSNSCSVVSPVEMRRAAASRSAAGAAQGGSRSACGAT